MANITSFDSDIESSCLLVNSTFFSWLPIIFNHTSNYILRCEYKPS